MTATPTKKRWLIAGLICCIPVLLEVYARWPASFNVPPLAYDSNTEHLVVVFHGSDGAENDAIKSLESALRQQFSGTNVEVIRYIWAPWSDNRLRASVNGIHTGAELANQVARSNVKRLHLIGHSAGAWPTNSLCESLRREGPQDITIKMTLLDPIGILGFFNLDWGSQNFGRCADFAEGVINTDDPVPGTNLPLQQAFNIDVTGMPHEGEGHEWPVEYFIATMSGLSVSTDRKHFDMPRGAVARESSKQ